MFFARGVERVSRHLLLVGGHAQLAQPAVPVFMDEGWTVSIIDRGDAPSARETVNAIQADITRDDELNTALRRVIDKSGPVTAVIFYTRYPSKPGRIEGHEEWQNAVEVGLRAPEIILNKLIQLPSNEKLLTSSVLVGSVLGRMVSLNQTASYHAVKAATEGLTRYLSRRFIPVGVRVNAVSPGYIFGKRMSGAVSLGGDNGVAPTLTTVPPIRADDIASVCAFLCSESSKAINGQIILTDGGYSNFEQFDLLSGMHVIQGQVIRD